MVIVTIDNVDEGNCHLGIMTLRGHRQYMTTDSRSDAHKFESRKDALIHLARAAGQGCIDEIDPEYPDDTLVIRIEPVEDDE